MTSTSAPSENANTSLRRRISRQCRRRRFSRTSFSCKRKAQKSSLKNNAKVSEKLETLKKLIPAGENINNGSVGSAEQLFQETADYIVLLKTQVLVLQKLIEYYGSCGKESSNENSLVS